MIARNVDEILDALAWPLQQMNGAVIDTSREDDGAIITLSFPVDEDDEDG